MTMMMAITPANTGRWMKKLLTGDCSLRRYGGARPQAHQVVDDDLVAALQPFQHRPVLADPGAGPDRALHRLAVGEGPDEAPAFVLQHRALRHDDRLHAAGGDAHTHELARQE